MNLVIDDAVEVKLASKTDEEKRRELGKLRSLDGALRTSSRNGFVGQLLLKGDNVSLIQALQ